MDSLVTDLISHLGRLDPPTLRRAAAEIGGQSDELRWFRATVAIDRAVRTQCRSVQAAADRSAGA